MTAPDPRYTAVEHDSKWMLYDNWKQHLDHAEPNGRKEAEELARILNLMNPIRGLA